jgi:hypothetical protein
LHPPTKDAQPQNAKASIVIFPTVLVIIASEAFLQL